MALTVSPEDIEREGARPDCDCSRRVVIKTHQNGKFDFDTPKGDKGRDLLETLAATSLARGKGNREDSVVD